MNVCKFYINEFDFKKENTGLDTLVFLSNWYIILCPFYKLELFTVIFWIYTDSLVCTIIKLSSRIKITFQERLQLFFLTLYMCVVFTIGSRPPINPQKSNKWGTVALFYITQNKACKDNFRNGIVSFVFCFVTSNLC